MRSHLPGSVHRREETRGHAWAWKGLGLASHTFQETVRKYLWNTNDVPHTVPGGGDAMVRQQNLCSDAGQGKAHCMPTVNDGDNFRS